MKDLSLALMDAYADPAFKVFAILWVHTGDKELRQPLQSPKHHDQPPYTSVFQHV